MKYIDYVYGFLIVIVSSTVFWIVLYWVLRSHQFKIPLKWEYSAIFSLTLSDDDNLYLLKLIDSGDAYENNMTLMHSFSIFLCSLEAMDFDIYT